MNETVKHRITMMVGVPHGSTDRVAVQLKTSGPPTDTLSAVMTLPEAKRFAEVIIEKAAEVQALLDARNGGESRIIPINGPGIVVPKTRL